MNHPDHISESLETIFWVEIFEFLAADPDPGSRIFLTLDPGVFRVVLFQIHFGSRVQSHLDPNPE